MDERMVLLALQEMKGIGWKTVLQVVAADANLAGAAGRSEEEWVQLGLQSTKAALLYNGLHSQDWTTLERNYQERGIACVTIWDAAYPPLLRETSQPPWVLYTIGDTGLFTHPAIALVGTRNPTVYGRRAAEDIAACLAASGVAVVSGLARGIDGAAHTGALAAKGATIAVVGGGVDVVYPPEHGRLHADIAAHGLIISEFPPGTRVQPGLFPLRNRIIAGLSLATVVVEAAERSGSLITADQALDESRDVYAVPGPMNSPKSRGTNQLLRQGARIVAEPADILRDYAHIPGIRQLDSAGRQVVQHTAEEEKILQFLSHEPTSIDRLLEMAQTNFGHLHEVLLSLTLKKSIKALPGAAYVKIESIS